MNDSAAPEMVLAITPKSPAIQLLRMLDLICSMVGMGSAFLKNITGVKVI
jgi:hypothetical protein